MANKKDLIEAQAFSRRRLLTAFTSGAPGGKELEPAKPLRAVFAGIALSVMVIVGGVFYGLMKPTLAEGWDNNNVIIAKDTGARYVAFDGVLYPVLNATSARLLLPADKYKPIVTTSSAISTAPVGPTIGILGAPDDVPTAAALVADGWTACPSPEGTAVSIPGDAVAAAAPTAALVRSDGRDYVVTGGTAHLVDERSSDAVLRAVGLVGITPLEVSSRWLNLFAAGAPLAPVEIAGEGEVVEGTDLVVGAAVQAVNSPDVYIVTADGELAPLSPLALQLYSLGTGAGASVLDVSQAEISDLPTALAPAGGVDWPADVLTPVAPGAAVCAVLGHDARALPTTSLATTFVLPTGDSVSVTPGSGALVAAGGEGVNGVNEVFVVDQGGTSYGIPDAGDDVLAQLGYARINVAVLTTAWMQFFASGPELTREAAATSPVGAGGATPLSAASATPSAAPSPAPGASQALEPAVAPSGDATSADAVEPKQCERGTEAWSTEAPKPFALMQQAEVTRVATGAGVVVAVVDSGIDVENLHMTNQVIGGINLVADGERADGMSDLFGHGTSVAGAIAAAKIQESGVVGLAPDAKLLAVRVYRGDDDESKKAGFGPDDRLVAEGIVWAVDNGATIVNVSMSGTQDLPELRQAVAYATSHGVLVVASAGNRGTTEDTVDSPRYPAAAPGALAVAAANLDGDVTDASIHGAHVDVAAPGQSVMTAMAAGGDCEFAGTAESSSYATAYVSAAAALIAQAHPDESPEQWSYRLMATAIRMDPESRNDLAGWGVIQPLDAILLVPGSGERGPQSPFVSTAPMTVPVATGTVTSHERVSPFEETRHLATGVAIVAAAVLGALGVLVTYRRRPRDVKAADASAPRPGLLDALRSELTRMR